MARIRGERWETLTSMDATLAECPRWSPDGTTVHWIDITRGILHQTEVSARTTRSREVGREIASLTLDAAGGIWAWVDGSIRRFDEDGVVNADQGPIPGLIGATARANDASWAPDGSLWISTMARDGTTKLGGVTRFEPPNRFTIIASGFAIGNGPVFDASRDMAYLGDSANRRVLRLPMAEPFDPEPFLTLGATEGYPDGMALDRSGNLWVAHYDGARISVWSPAGVRLRTIHTPCACPTAIDLKHSGEIVRAAVTSAATGRESGGLWGLTMPAFRQQRKQMS